MARTIKTFVLLGAFVLMTNAAHAALLAYEGFDSADYGGADTIWANTFNGGSGWDGAWGGSGSAGFQYRAPGGLSYTGLATSNPGHGEVTDTAWSIKSRALDLTAGGAFDNAGLVIDDPNGRPGDKVVGGDGKTLWASFLVNSSDHNANIGFDTDDANPFELSIFEGTQGSPGSWWALEAGFFFGLDNAPGQTQLMVLKFDFSATGYTLSDMWVDPAIDTGAPVGGSHRTGVTEIPGGFSHFNFRNISGSPTPYTGKIDEIRFGETSQDVLPAAIVPEPSALALLALAGLGGILRRRR